MGKAKRKPTKPMENPLEVRAKEAMNAGVMRHGEYEPVTLAEKDAIGGVTLDTVAMMKLAPVRSIESLMKPNARRKGPFLEQYHISAANSFFADVCEARGSMSHEVRDFVDRSPTLSQQVSEGQQMAIRTLAKIEHRMTPNMWAYARRVFIYHPEKTLSELFPSKHMRGLARDAIKDMLHWLAVEYGIISN